MMREGWEKYKLDMENEPELFKDLMLNNCLSEYMNFMYDTYPIGYGNKHIECIENNLGFDGAETFYNLKIKDVQVNDSGKLIYLLNFNTFFSI